MKLRKITATASLLVLAVAGACDDGLTDINRNPNQPTEVSPEYLFPQGVVEGVRLVHGAGFDLTFTGLWAQHYSKIQYVDEDRYEMRPGTTDAWWANFYAGPLMDLEKAIQQADGRAGLVAPAMVAQSWLFGVMTDTWGDIPYSEALQGDVAGSGTTPSYDTQQAIYNGILADLATANSLLNDASGGYGSADPIYGGNLAKWQKAANSLRLRYAMRLANVDPTKAAAEAAAAAAAGVFESNADNMVLVWPGDGTNDSPFAVNFRTRDDHRVSATLVDTLQTLDDPRLAIYAQLANDTAAYIGVPNGLTNADALEYGLSRTSKLGTYFSQDNTPSVIIDYAEVLFLLAEAAQRGWIPGDPAALYEQAIIASMSMYGISQAEIDAYLAQPEVAFDPNRALEQIWLQSWIALFHQGAEAYAHVRRTDVPALVPGPAAQTDVLPGRLPYPDSEQSTNSASLQAAVAAQGDVSLTGNVWWDVN